MLKNVRSGVVLPSLVVDMFCEMNPSLVVDMSSGERKYHDSPKIPAVALCPAHNSGSMSEGLQESTR